MPALGSSRERPRMSKRPGPICYGTGVRSAAGSPLLPMEDYLTMIYRWSGRGEETSTTALATPRVWMLPAVPTRSSVPRRGGRS